MEVTRTLNPEPWGVHRGDWRCTLSLVLQALRLSAATQGFFLNTFKICFLKLQPIFVNMGHSSYWFEKKKKLV